MRKSLNNEYTTVRQNAAEALENIGQPAGEPLNAALKDDNFRIRKEAAEVLDNLAWKPSGPVEMGVYLVATNACDELAELGTPAVEPLSSLQTEGGGVAEDAVGARGSIGDAQAVEALIAMLKEEDEEYVHVPRKAESALYHIGVPAVGPLIAALKDENEIVRSHVVEALAPIRDIRAIEPLIDALEDDYVDVRRTAAWGLGEIGDSLAVEPLIGLLKDNHERVAKKAADSLGKIGDSRAVEPLIAMLDTNLDGNNARWALEKIVGEDFGER